MLERSSIDKCLTFDVSLIQLTFHTIVFTLCMQRVFNPNVTLFQFNSTEGLHLVLFIIILVCFSIHSLIHYYCIVLGRYRGREGKTKCSLCGNECENVSHVL